MTTLFEFLGGVLDMEKNFELEDDLLKPLRTIFLKK